ncbi:MAG: hypothetical protein ACR2L6_11820 [Gemmatimonadaceae bacterium]
MSDSIQTLLLENFQPRPGRGSWHGGATAVGAQRGVSAAQAAGVPARGRKSIWQLTLHDAYHTSQIQLLKRQWAANRGDKR